MGSDGPAGPVRSGAGPGGADGEFLRDHRFAVSGGRHPRGLAVHGRAAHGRGPGLLGRGGGAVAGHPPAGREGRAGGVRAAPRGRAAPPRAPLRQS